MQYKRINVRTVEILVKKYSQIVSPLKKITPHKLRSTYGTRLYNETGDIYIKDGRQLMTLITCTPDGHGGFGRYLVICEKK